MKFLILLTSIFISTSMHAQVIEPPSPSDQPPGTVKVECQVLRSSKSECHITILKILAEGQGLVNRLAEGDTLRVTTIAKSPKLSSKHLIADLKEKLGPDASESEYVIINAKKAKE